MNLPRRQFLYLTAATTALLPICAPSARAQTYPTRPVRVVVPLSAGSAADILARQLATKMSEGFGQPVVVENRPGAGTTLGADAVAKSAPDGHTLLINSAAFAASAAVYPKLPYDPLKDLAPISQIAIAPVVVMVAPSLGAKSIRDLVELAKSQPGRMNFGSAGVGSSTHFAGEQFKLAAGLNAVHVPYKGPSEALLDTMTGRIQYCLSPTLPALPFITDKRLLALGVTTAERSPMLHDVPTIAEAGTSIRIGGACSRPQLPPPAVIEKVNKAIARVLELPETRQQLLAQGAEARSSTPQEFAGFVRAKIESARRIATVAAIRPE